MNDLKALTGSIIDQAQAEAAQLAQETAAEVDKIMARAQQQAEERSRKLAEAYRQKAEIVERRLAIAAELEGKKRLLAAKHTLIEAAFSQAVDSLAKLPAARRTKFLAAQLAAAGAEYGGEVQAAGGTQAEWTAIIKEANELLARTGKLAQLTLTKEQPDFTGGFRLTGPGFTVDGSYRALVEEVKENLVPEVATYLFGKAEE
jgi:V/A-type H+-transporting ATPase subunit E